MDTNDRGEEFPEAPSMPPPPPPAHSSTTFQPSSRGQGPEPSLQEASISREVRPSSYTISRKPIPIPRVDPSEGAYVQESPSSEVRVHSASDWSQPEPFSVAIEDHGSLLSPSHSVTASVRQSTEDYSLQPNPLKVPPPSEEMPIRLLGDTSKTTSIGHASQQHKRGRSLPDASGQFSIPESVPSRSTHDLARDASRPVENHQPLQYHHQAMEERSLRPVDKRASRVTMHSTYSDGSSNSDPTFRNDHLAPAPMRNSFAGRLPRPDSAYSSISDLAQSRGRSPQLSPSGYARASPTHSATLPTDQRPLSFVDLLNVPYPQPPPVSADHLDNAKLRNSIGINASLLSTRQTLEMYRANVKKTNDPAIQYEFAVFMISAAQEVPPDPESASTSEKSFGSSHGDLLKEARQILQRLSDRSYPFAQYYLADGYSSGLFTKGKQDYEKAFPLFVSASNHGHAEAGYRAALCYEFGWGCRVDAAKASQFYRQAASKNHPGAMLRLGRACLVGDMGLGKKYREGVKWLKRAAESADFQYNSAPFELGLLHETGYGADIFRDESYAAQLFTKSADLGHAEANFRLGDAYEHGKLSCPRDPALSVHFYTGAAQQSHPLAMMALCAWYMVGAEPVLEKDENEAYEWARKAAETELPKAEYTVGFFTETGIGCRRDPLEANVWYVRAADHGDERAKHRIAAIRAAATGANSVTAALPTGNGDNTKGKDGNGMWYQS
jgi:TPR repeat protein